MNDKNDNNPKKIHEASASMGTSSSFESSAEVIKYDREERFETESKLTDPAVRNLSQENIVALQERCKRLITHETWDEIKLAIARETELSPSTIIDFATKEISFRNGRVTLKENKYDRGSVIYEKTLDKLTSFFDRIVLPLFTEYKSNDLKRTLMAEKIYFDKAYESDRASEFRKGLEEREGDLRNLRLHLADLKSKKDNLNFDADASDECQDLIKRFNREGYFIYGGLFPSFYLEGDFREGVILLSSIPLEKVKEANAKARSNSKLHNDKLSLIGKWDELNFEDLSETARLAPLEENNQNIIIHEVTAEPKGTRNFDNSINTISPRQAAIHLRSNGIIAMPTEGLFGLSCNPDSEQAVNNLLLLKERSKNKGLIITSGDISHLFKYFNGENFKYFDEAQRVWSEEPSTILIPKNEACSTWLSGEFETIALRLSDHPQIKKITKEFGGPIVTTSANLSGAKDIESLDELDEAFGKNALIVRGELGSLGGATRIVDLVNEKETIRYAKLAVVGKPISHSKSPEIHNDFAQQHSLKINFAKEEVGPESLKGWLEDFFGPKSWGRGVSVTLPLKQTAVGLADQVTDEARLAGSSNVIYRKNGKILADNTDGKGLATDLEKNLDFPLEGKKVLLLGAGGAARGIIPAILEKKPSLLKIANRSEEKANSLRIYFESNIQGIRERKIISSGSLSDEFLLSNTYDLVINATSVSTLSEESLGLPKALFSGTKLAYDLFYSAEKTTFMQEALAGGAEKVSDGWGMLVEQGAESFRLWTNLIPDTSRLLEKPID